MDERCNCEIETVNPMIQNMSNRTFPPLLFAATLAIAVLGAGVVGALMQPALAQTAAAQVVAAGSEVAFTTRQLGCR